MLQTHPTLMLLLAFLTGLAGGLAAQLWPGPPPVRAASQSVTTFLAAQEFRVVDPATGQTLASFGMRSTERGTPQVSLQMLTRAYGKASGIVLTADDYETRLSLMGRDEAQDIGITMFVFNSVADRPATAEMEVGSLRTAVGEAPNQTRVSLGTYRSAAGLAVLDHADHTRLVLGHGLRSDRQTGPWVLPQDAALAFFTGDGSLRASLP